MTTGIRITYGEMRSNAEKLADEQLKARILRGIDVLNKKFGPDWVDHIDPGTLDLASPNACVLGQVYDGAEVTDEQWEVYTTHNGWPGPWAGSAGYNRGLAILNADVAIHPHDYGFETSGEYDYADLDEAWLIVLGEEG